MVKLIGKTMAHQQGQLIGKTMAHQQGHHKPKTKSSKIDPFLKLLHKVSKDLTLDEIETLKLFVSDDIAAGELEQISSATNPGLRIFHKLKELGAIKRNNLEWIKEYLSEIDKPKLLQLVEDFEEGEKGKSWADGWNTSFDRHPSVPSTPDNRQTSTSPRAQRGQVASETPQRSSVSTSPNTAPFNVPIPGLLTPPKTPAQSSPVQGPHLVQSPGLVQPPGVQLVQPPAPHHQIHSSAPAPAVLQSKIPTPQPAAQAYPTVEANLNPVACSEESPHVHQPTNTPDIPSSTKESVNTPLPVSVSGQYPAECTETPSGNLNIHGIQHMDDSGPAGSTPVGTPSPSMRDYPAFAASGSVSPQRNPLGPVQISSRFQGSESQVRRQSSSTQERTDIQKDVPEGHEAALQRSQSSTREGGKHVAAEIFKHSKSEASLNPISNQHKLQTALVKPLLRNVPDVEIEETEVKKATDQPQSSQREMDLGGNTGLERPLQGPSLPPQDSMDVLKAEQEQESNIESRIVEKQDSDQENTLEIEKAKAVAEQSHYLEGIKRQEIATNKDIVKRNRLMEDGNRDTGLNVLSQPKGKAEASTSKIHVDGPSSMGTSGVGSDIEGATSLYQKLAAGQRLPQNRAKIIMDREEQHRRHKIETDRVHRETLLFRRDQMKKNRKDIELYSYQLELAEAALEGKNCILCAPTGSGKTLTAGYVCHTKWQAAKSMTKRHKTLFIVCIRNLINQQTEALQLIFKEDPNKSNVVAGITEVQTLSEMMNTQDIIVLTAQILVNSLRNKEVSLDDFDLLIMDECHHTNLAHPYNIIMEFYLDEKRASPGKPLPQILGLTASLGVGDNKDDALDHYILMCANLDCNHITHVRNDANLAELYKHNPKPKKDQIISVGSRDPNDMFSLILNYMMKEIEEYVKELPKLKPQRATQHYENWVVENRLEAEKKDLQDAIYGCLTLQKLNTALMFYDELQGKEVIKILKEYFKTEIRSEIPRRVEGQIYHLYDEQIKELEEAALMEKIFDNPKLERLSQLLDALYETKPKSKGILLTRTRTSVDGLVAFIESQRALRELVRPARFVGQGRKDSTMTDVEQESTLMSFKSDDDRSFNLLVATDVAQEGLDMPQCNFVIRYNFVSNEIGSVQSRGRARAKNSECYLIVNKNSTNEAREYENLEKEHLMLEALKDIDLMDPEKLKHSINEKQIALRQDRLAKNQRRSQIATLLDPSDVDVVCKNCKLFLCKGDNMRKRGSNFIVIDPMFEDRTKQTSRSKPLNFRDDSHVGYVFCGDGECSRQLGPKIQYNKGIRRSGYALSKDAVMWRYDNEDDYRQIKQWSKVPFTVIEEAITY